jgi:RND superfamily putative drug exporter
VQRGRPRAHVERELFARGARDGRRPSEPRDARSSGWHRWGVAMARNRRIVFFVWAVVLLVCLALYPTLKEVLGAPNYSVNGSQSAQVEQLLNTSLRGAGSEQDALVFYSREHRATSRAYRAVVARVLHDVRSQPGVVAVYGPYGTDGQPAAISADRHAALARVALAGDSRRRLERAGEMESVVAAASRGGVRAWLTGFSPIAHDLAQVETADTERAEAIGLPIAMAILLLALGAWAAAMLPLLQAGAGLLLTYGAIALLARVVSFDSGMLAIVTMIGVGIGIDYSLFIVSRFREELARTPPQPRRERGRISGAVGAAMATSGRTVLYSGAIVGLSLLSLLAIHAPIFGEFAVGTLTVVACTLAAALTLLPATLAQLGPRINTGSLPLRLQPAEVRRQAEGESGWARWAFAMMRRPILAASLVAMLLIVSMAPMLGIKYGINLALAPLSSKPSGEGAAVLAHSFSPGSVGPIQIVVRGGGERRSATATLRAERGGARELEHELRGDRRVAGMVRSSYPAGVLLSVTPAVAIDSPAAAALVTHIRADLAPALGKRAGVAVLVGGWPAQGVDFSAETTSKLPVVLAVTLGVALLFLLVVFRSVVLPIKAVLMNLLATGATLGLVVLIFQDGHGERLLGFVSPGYIQTYLPLFMFVMLFGLSMDYEVFLIRRMQEAWLKSGENRFAVASGVEHTARPIAAAAAIMVAVFGSFVTVGILELQQFGFALAAAIAIDATLIRLVLVPALMCLLGARNWWLPAGLERRLPRLELD